jgi:hypothetical protein
MRMESPTKTITYEGIKLQNGGRTKNCFLTWTRINQNIKQLIWQPHLGGFNLQAFLMFWFLENWYARIGCSTPPCFTPSMAGDLRIADQIIVYSNLEQHRPLVLTCLPCYLKHQIHTTLACILCEWIYIQLRPVHVCSTIGAVEQCIWRHKLSAHTHSPFIWAFICQRLWRRGTGSRMRRGCRL